MTLVRYLATPVELFIELQETLDALQRELQLASLDGGGGTDGSAAGDAMVTGMVVHRDAMVDVRSALYDQAVAAREAGHVLADLEAEYPDDSVDAVLAITSAARRAERAAAAGEMLTPAPRAEVRHLQAWIFEEVERQLSGGEPTPYPAGPPG